MTHLLPLLEEFYRDKLTMMLRHQAAAQHVAQYNVNNTYQYVINREDVQLSWLATAITGLGATLPAVDDPARSVSGKADQVAQHVIEEDARDAQAFVDRWRPRVEAMTHARHRGMLRVILGEGLEQARFFQQALAGRTDLLGRRADVLGPSHGAVLPSRWIE